MNYQQLAKYLICALLVYAYYYAVAVFWGYSVSVNPITNALFECCVAEVWFLTAIYSHDIVLNVILMVPLACCIHLFGGDHKKWYLRVALAVLLLSSYSFVLPALLSSSTGVLELSMLLHGVMLPACFFAALMVLKIGLKR